MFGNPTFWTAPVAAAALGAEAAVFVIAYDMLTQARIAVGVRPLRAHAPRTQSARTALADYAPTICAMSGLALGIVFPAPEVIDTVVAGARHRDGDRRASSCSASPGRATAGPARPRPR